MNKALRILLVLFLLLLGLYVGAAGWVASGLTAPSTSENVKITGPVTVDGITFADLQSAERYMKEKEVDSWFPWMRNPLPPLFIACIGFGLVGGAIGRLKSLISSDSTDVPQILLHWIFAGAVGLVLYFIINVFLDGRSGRNLFFIVATLVGGIFSEETYDWIGTKARTILDMISKKSA